MNAKFCLVKPNVCRLTTDSDLTTACILRVDLYANRRRDARAAHSTFPVWNRFTTVPSPDKMFSHSGSEIREGSEDITQPLHAHEDGSDEDLEMTHLATREPTAGD